MSVLARERKRETEISLSQSPGDKTLPLTAKEKKERKLEKNMQPKNYNLPYWDFNLLHGL